MNQTIGARTVDLGEASKETVECLTIVGSALQAQARAMIEASNKAAADVTNVIIALKDESGALETSASIAEERVESIGRVFRAETQELASASEHASRQVDSVRQSLQRHSSDMTSTLDRAADQATQIGAVFAEQSEELIQSSDLAEKQAKLVRQNSFDARRDMFLRASHFIIEDLNSTAIDLNRLLDDVGSQKLWPRLARGEKGIFVKSMLQEDARHARDVIKGKFVSDDNFRKYVQRYLDHFERLLNEANESDPENLLSSTFLSADIGKLYLVLARSVGRLN